MKVVDYDRIKNGRKLRDVWGEEEEEEKKGGGVVMNRCGQPYLASSLSLLCGIRRTLGSLDDDAGHLANHFG